MDFCQIKYQDPATQTYIGSPSLVRLPSGDLLATHDYFGPGCPRNHEREEHLSSVYCSRDNGQSWECVTHVASAYWSTLFLHQNALYLLGTSQQYGSLVIRRSLDEGRTWTHPWDEQSGLLLKGGYYHEPPNYHCAPVPVLHHQGQLYRAFEDCDPCVWGTGFRSLVISADEEADLLRADSWTVSNKLAFDPAWVPAAWGPLECPGWLEGNMVAAPDGALWNILRVNSTPLANKAAFVKVLDEGRTLEFDPQEGFVDFPGGMTKFTIRRDPISGKYLSLVNPVPPDGLASQRKQLALSVSSDLRHWEVKHTLLDDDSPLSPNDSARLTGFQYVDWQFDNEDLIYLVRTAYDGAHNYHDANRLTYHTLPGFRAYL